MLKIFYAGLVLLSFTAIADDRNIEVKSLRVGESVLVQYKNPTRENSQTRVTCMASEEDAARVLETTSTGGVMLLTGGQVVFKNEVSSRSRNRDRRDSFTQVDCKGRG